MKKDSIKKYQEGLMDSTKRTMGLGAATMAGGYALGSMASLPGMPAQAQQTANIAQTGMNLANIGNVAAVGMQVAKLPVETKKKKKDLMSCV